MNLRQLEVFHAVMRAGSVTGAAKLLGATQPSVSTVLKHCEAQLRTALFRRVGGRLQPTAEAQAIMPDIEAVFARLDSVERRLRDLKGGQLGTLSIAGTFAVTNGFLAEAVAAFMAERPEIRVVLQSMNSPQVSDRVASREVEIGFAFDPVVHPAVETELVMRSGLECVMRDDHPLARQDAVAMRDLEGQPIITYLPRTTLRGHVDRALADAGVVPDIRAQVSHSLAGLALAYRRAGIALVEPFQLHSLPIPGLVTRPLRPTIEVRTLMVSLRTAPRSALVQQFVAHLVKFVAALPRGG